MTEQKSGAAGDRAASSSEGPIGRCSADEEICRVYVQSSVALQSHLTGHILRVLALKAERNPEAFISRKTLLSPTCILLALPNSGWWFT